MRVLPFSIALGFGALLAPGVTAASAAPDDVVRNALPFLAREGQAWREDRGCVSCHQIPFQVWSERAATRAGHAIGAPAMEELTAWALDWRHWMQPDRQSSEADAVAGNADTMAQLLLAHPGETAPWVVGFRERILSLQQETGAWKAGGQLPLQRRPIRETNEASTGWILLALAAAGTPENSFAPARDRALEWLAAGAPGVSTEWWALRLLTRHEFGTEEESAAARNDLLALQHPDGSWGWIASEPGDALATGIAVYALARTARPNDAGVERAIDFLSSTQRDDGSWAVPGTRTKDQGKIRPTSTYWGTAWAVIGLLEADHASPPPADP